jgi:hypothetical protein
VRDKEVVGVAVKSKGFKDVKLFFDKQTGLLVKTARQGLSPEGKEVGAELIYLEHKKFDGILRPSKAELYMDGKLTTTTELVELKHLDKIDKKEFDVSD